MTDKKSGVSVVLREISHHYLGTGPILEGVNLKVEEGEFTSILGPSGCGKSTLLRLLAALERPAQGTIEFGPPSVPLIRGFVFQEPRLLPWRTVLGNVSLPLELKGMSKKEAQPKATEALIRIGLADSLQKYPSQLSGGMKMRVSVARALVFQPNLLLLDEPFSALDEYSRLALQDDLRVLWSSSKMTVIFVTHSVAEAVYLSERVIVFSQRPARIFGDTAVDLPTSRDASIRMENQFGSAMKGVSQFLSLRER